MYKYVRIKYVWLENNLHEYAESILYSNSAIYYIII